LGRHAGQGLEQTLFHGGEALEGRFAGRAVDAIAGLSQHPLVQLPIGVCQVAEFTQWQEAALDVFDARFHDALLLRIPGRTRIDLESIALRHSPYERCTSGSYTQARVIAHLALSIVTRRGTPPNHSKARR
jgi:hypothetical protein